MLAVIKIDFLRPFKRVKQKLYDKAFCTILDYLDDKNPWQRTLVFQVVSTNEILYFLNVAKSLPVFVCGHIVMTISGVTCLPKYIPEFETLGSMGPTGKTSR